MYEALAVLSTHQKFREKLRKARAISTLVCEIDARRRMLPSRSRRDHHQHQHQGDRHDEDIATILLFAALKKDWAATKIQAVYRACLTRRHGFTKRDYLFDWSVDTISYVS